MKTPQKLETKPLNLFPYQAAFAADKSRFKIGLWARQTGKDFTCTFEAVSHCLRHPEATWLIVAAGERQALESLEKAKAWAAFFNSAIDAPGSPPGNSGFHASSTSITWPNGSRIIALPAKPETVRGYSANVILTEFAFHDDPEAIWRAVFPSVSNPLRGGPKMLRVITTPNGHGDFFHDLWRNADFFKHCVTIHDAISQGLPLDPAQLRQGIFDPAAWSQEYECAFTDRHSVLLPYALIEACESPEARESSNLQELSRASGELYLGIDFGRQHDLTAAWMLERIRANSTPGLPPRETLRTREVLVLERVPTPEQFEILRERASRARRVCVDYTGAGVGLGDLLARAFGGKIECCSFTSALKAELFPKLRAAFEQGILQIPSSQNIREELHALHRVTTGTGQLHFRATRTADGHSDRATALALALRASEQTGFSSGATSTPGPRHFHTTRRAIL